MNKEDDKMRKDELRKLKALAANLKRMRRLDKQLLLLLKHSQEWEDKTTNTPEEKALQKTIKDAINNQIIEQVANYQVENQINQIKKDLF